MAVTIQFLGGAGTVTGSKFLVRSDRHRILVDCGLFQGLKELRLQNWARFPVPPREIDAVILTHAHLDHSGYLPLLVRNGFHRKIHCTAPTLDLSKIILEDSARIQEEDAAYANRKGYSKHEPARPLYTEKDAKSALRCFSPIQENRWTEILPGVETRLRCSGHILGSTFVELRIEGKTIVFSGDLGRSHPLILRRPSVIDEADFLLIESTYGDRIHDAISPLHRLAGIVHETVRRGGHLLIPSFAIGRTQDLLFLFSLLKAERQIPDVPIYLDSPMGINATEIFAKHAKWHALNAKEVKALCETATLVKTQSQSKSLLGLERSSIVIAGSGMLTGGRILHHLESRLPDPRNTVLLVGYQAAGTRGRLLQNRIPELKFHGKYVPVRAEIEEITTLSGHADQKEIIEWLKNFRQPPRRTFIVHGEPQASDALRVRIQDALDWDCTAARAMQTVEL